MFKTIRLKARMNRIWRGEAIFVRNLKKMFIAESMMLPRIA